jgi:FkbM family methyltransferase
MQVVKALPASIQQRLGVVRALYQRYRGGHGAWRDALLRPFVSPGDLVFDLGANVGDCIASLRRLEARVVAIEPQPAMLSVLRLLHGRDRQVSIEPVAVGALVTEAELFVNPTNPSVSTLSTAFIEAARQGQQWQGQHWRGQLRVPMMTLDALIARYGEPRFCKIDVEGYECEVLQGLSRPLAALSFEFTTIQREVALRALDEMARLGAYRYKAALGASPQFEQAHWLSAAEIARWMQDLPESANSGDLYAVRIDD